MGNPTVPPPARLWPYITDYGDLLRTVSKLDHTVGHCFELAPMSLPDIITQTKRVFALSAIWLVADNTPPVCIEIPCVSGAR